MKQLTKQERRLLFVSGELLKGAEHLRDKYDFDWDYTASQTCAIGLTGVIYERDIHKSFPSTREYDISLIKGPTASRFLGLSQEKAKLIFFNGDQFPQRPVPWHKDEMKTYNDACARIVGANMYRTFELGMPVVTLAEVMNFVKEYGPLDPHKLLAEDGANVKNGGWTNVFRRVASFTLMA